MKPSATDLYRAARVLADGGQPVFPCKSVGAKAKAPLTKNGLLDASLEPLKIRDWWRANRDASIGITTGVLWDVLDVDTKGGTDGRVHLPYLTRVGLLNGCKRVVRTPSGGWHLYFKAAPGLTNKARAHLGLDVRSLGGYVLAPPSFLTDAEGSDGSIYSGAYEDFGPTTGSTDEPLLWDLIVGALAPVNTTTKKPVELLAYERRGSLRFLRGWLSERQPGERNHSLYWAVCRCIDNGIDPHELVDVATLLGLEEEEVLLTIGSALRRAEVNVNDLHSEAEALFGTD